MEAEYIQIAPVRSELKSIEDGDNFKNSNLPPNPQLTTDKLSEYSEEIYQHLMEKEQAYIPLPIQNSCETSQFIRTKLVDWLFKVSKVFNFKI